MKLLEWMQLTDNSVPLAIMSFHITNNWCNITPASENGNHLVVFICRFLFISFYKLHSILLDRMNAVSTFIIPINIIFIIKPEPLLNHFKKPFCFNLSSLNSKYIIIGYIPLKIKKRALNPATHSVVFLMSSMTWK